MRTLSETVVSEQRSKNLACAQQISDIGFSVNKHPVDETSCPATPGRVRHHMGSVNGLQGLSGVADLVAAGGGLGTSPIVSSGSTAGPQQQWDDAGG